MRIIVIGSGIAGAGTAYHLARQGAEVTVVDAGLDGAATAAGAGIVSPWTSRRLVDGDELAFAARAAAYYPPLVELLAEDGVGDTSFEVVGGMIVSQDEGLLRGLRDRIATRAESWPEVGEVSLLDEHAARALFPALHDGFGAVHVTGSGRVDGRVLRQGMLDAAVTRGARLLEAPARLVSSAGRVTGVATGDEELPADAVVVAAGAWSAELLAPLGVQLAVEPQRGQITHFALPGVDTTAWPVVLPVSTHYLLAFPGSRVVAGATREDGSGFDHRVTAAGQREVLAEALAVAPGLAEATLAETRVGFRPASPDGRPLVGRLGAYPEVTVVSGFGPSGLTLGPYAARLAADLVLGEEPSKELVEELQPLRPERFTP